MCWLVGWGGGAKLLGEKRGLWLEITVGICDSVRAINGSNGMKWFIWVEGGDILLVLRFKPMINETYDIKLSYHFSGPN